MSIYNQLEILRQTKVNLNSSIESLGEDLTNKVFGAYSDSVTNVYLFLQQLNTDLDALIVQLNKAQDDLVNLDTFLGTGNTLLQKILDPVSEQENSEE